MTTRCGFIAVAGAPNAGKSTLVNALVGAKVSIVSPKVQTTRSRVLGIAMAGQSQLLFIDTPGIFQDPKRKLERAMVKAAWSGIGDADFVALVIDAARGLDRESAAIIERLATLSAPRLLVLNKVDLVKPQELLGLTAKLNEMIPFDATFMVSALSGDGVETLRADLASRVPEGPWHYPEDQTADLPMRQLAAELTREQLFLQLFDELPYSVMVETEQWQERPDGSVRVEQVITVMRDGQKAIVLGEKGQRIKALGAAARAQIGEAIERTVHLFLHVRVREKWVEDPRQLRAMGLEPDQG